MCNERQSLQLASTLWTLGNYQWLRKYTRSQFEIRCSDILENHDKLCFPDDQIVTFGWNDITSRKNCCWQKNQNLETRSERQCFHSHHWFFLHWKFLDTNWLQSIADTSAKQGNSQSLNTSFKWRVWFSGQLWTCVTLTKLFYLSLTLFSTSILYAACCRSHTIWSIQYA